MKKSINLILVAVFITTSCFVGCRKKETTEVDNETQSAVDNAVADQEYAAIVPAVNSHAINTKGTGHQDRIMAACDSLTKISGDTLFGQTGHIDPTYTMSVNNAGCNLTMPDGKARTGFIKVKLTGKIKNPGSKMIINLMNYKTNGAITYSCDSIIVTTLASSSVAPVFSSFNIKLFGGVCQTSNWVIKYKFDRTFKNYPKGKTNGGDPVVEVFGTSSGVNREGRAFTVNTPQSSQCIKHKSCEFIDKGIIELTPDGFKTRTIDFGNGTCDDNAVFTVNGSTVAFKLK